VHNNKIKIMIIDKPYYEDRGRINNGLLNIYNKSGPQGVKKWLDGGEIESFAAADNGIMVHCYLLEHEKFWKEYEILDFKVPTKQKKEFIDAWTQSTELLEDTKLLESYNKAYNNKKTDKEKLTEAQTILDESADYIQYASTKKYNKKVISFADLNKLKLIKDNITNHKAANDLLYGKVDNGINENEYHINWEWPNKISHNDTFSIKCDTFSIKYDTFSIKCKSLLDKLIINHDTKEIKLIDLKTTAHLYGFKSAMDQYNYWQQMSYYWMAIHWLCKYELNINIEEYTYSTYIVAISSNTSEIRVFKLNNSDIENEVPKIQQTVEKIKWHMMTNQWDHTKEYYEGDGLESLY
jgi:hypothetical protein